MGIFQGVKGDLRGTSMVCGRRRVALVGFAYRVEICSEGKEQDQGGEEH